MAGGGGSGGERKLDQTPTWAVASVCAVIIIISILLEKVLEKVGKWFTERRKRALFEALEKVKSELMVMGFISLLLTFSQSYIARICISEKLADNMLPCAPKTTEEKSSTNSEEEPNRRLLVEMILANVSPRRILAGGESGSTCSGGKVSLVSADGVHQLHIFIFFLAVFHVAYTAVTMALGRLKIRRWKEWEQETLSLHYEFSNDPARFRFARETSFVKAHSSWWNRAKVSFYLISFFRQFFRSVRQADYLTMRHGFIAVHLSPGSKFNFQKYIKRALEDDFKIIVGISPPLWASAVIFLLLSVNGWETLFWLSIIPVVIILAIGTKLQAIIAKMAVEVEDRHAVVQGMPLVQLGDKHFWFSSPKLVLFLIHFSLFQNAFVIVHFLWILYEFGLRSCYHDRFGFTIARLVLGVGVLFLCSYITLPLYALVSQMGSLMKRSIFDEETTKALERWTKGAKKRGNQTPRRTPGPSPGISPNASPAHSLQRFKTTGHMGFGSSTMTKRTHFSDHELSDIEGEDGEATTSQTAILIENMQGREGVIEGDHEGEDFSFVKPAPP